MDNVKDLDRKVRAIFLHGEYLADLIMTLKFDRFLVPLPDHTVIFVGHGDPEIDYFSQIQFHGIDCSHISIVADQELLSEYAFSNVDVYRYGGWISQQLIKLAALDSLLRSHDVVLIQDCDTFNVQPYHWIIDNKILQMYGISYIEQQDQYDEYVYRFTGQKKQTHYGFVSEFMPVRKSSWDLLKDYLQQNGHHWLKTIDLAFQQDPNEQVWFSEYELLGNWNLLVDKQVNIVEQKRFELERKNGWSSMLHRVGLYNVVANVNHVISLNDVDNYTRQFEMALDVPREK